MLSFCFFQTNAYPSDNKGYYLGFDGHGNLQWNNMPYGAVGNLIGHIANRLNEMPNLYNGPPTVKRNAQSDNFNNLDCNTIPIIWSDWIKIVKHFFGGQAYPTGWEAELARGNCVVRTHDTWLANAQQQNAGDCVTEDTLQFKLIFQVCSKCGKKSILGYSNNP